MSSTTDWKLLPTELTGIICSWNGESQEFGVFYNSGIYTVRKGEFGGPTDRGAFRDFFTL
jgi:hypothetical protein